MDRHIFLIGMPGSGKSSLGKKVASNLELAYVDTDQRIEQAFGCPTSQIFEKLSLIHISEPTRPY